MARKDGEGKGASEVEPARGPGGDGAPLGELVGQVVRRLVSRGRNEFERAATRGRQRLEVRQLQKDRDAFWIRMGKTAYRLVESGELEHPALRKAMKRIDELEHQLEELKKNGPTPEEAHPEPADVEES